MEIEQALNRLLDHAVQAARQKESANELNSIASALKEKIDNGEQCDMDDLRSLLMALKGNLPGHLNSVMAFIEDIGERVEEMMALTFHVNKRFRCYKRGAKQEIFEAKTPYLAELAKDHIEAMEGDNVTEQMFIDGTEECYAASILRARDVAQEWIDNHPDPLPEPQE